MLAERIWEHDIMRETVSVNGKLAEAIEFWREVVQAPAYILHVDTIRYVYVLRFHEEPTEFSRPNQALALESAVCLMKQFKNC